MVKTREVIDTQDNCRETALRSLDRSAQSRAMLEAKLLQRGFSLETVTAITERFAEVGLLNDAEYAAALVRTRHQERGLARRAIATELARKGITGETASRALFSIDDDAERDMALVVAQQTLSSTEGLDSTVRYRRALAKLARRGYSSELAYHAVQQALEDC
ncbi:MAG: recombination regulator RecX [Promicromonosporaceae bacterium]|nr:recombination regulator RecX [Promicromonosporaceae bacterium]